MNKWLSRGTAKTVAYFQNTRGIFLFIIGQTMLVNFIGQCDCVAYTFVNYFYNLNHLHMLKHISLCSIIVFKKNIWKFLNWISNNIPSTL